jgi:hypothetical protein
MAVANIIPNDDPPTKKLVSLLFSFEGDHFEINGKAHGYIKP